MLCGECELGYSDWAGQCVACSNIDWGVTTLLLCIGFVVVTILVMKKPDSSAYFKLLIDYGQLVVLVLSPLSNISQSLR